VMRCWCGYLPVARCRLFAHGPADATPIPKPHNLLPHLMQTGFIFLELAYPGCPRKRPLNGCSSSSSSRGGGGGCGGGGSMSAKLNQTCILKTCSTLSC